MAKRNKLKGKTFNPHSLKAFIFKYFLKNPKKRMDAGSLRKKLKIANAKPDLITVLDLLVKENAIRSVGERKYVLKQKAEDKADRSDNTPIGTKKLLIGRVDSIRSGAAYIIIEDYDKDIYVHARHLKSAINGDIVEVEIKHVGGKNPEGRVRNIIKRNTSQIVGTINIEKRHGNITPASKKINLEVFVKKEKFNNAKNGDRVIVNITDYGTAENPTIWGEVDRVIADLSEHDFTMESILVENGFSSDYPDEVIKEVEKFEDKITQEEIDKRRDFREVLTFTIDPDTAQDFDDAISYQVLENGEIEIGVHIADVTHFLRPNTALDKEAFERSTSVYLVDRCIAMLPEKLSNVLCSLNPNVDRLVFSAVFTFDSKYKLIAEWYGKSIIHSDKRFTYENAQESLDDKDGIYHEELTVVNKIAHKLRKEKFKKGAIAFETDEVKFILDENKKPTGVFVKKRLDTHLLVEDFMLLANRKVAEYISTKNTGQKIPFVYRIHDLPDLDRLVDLSLFMQDFDVKLDLSTPDNISQSFNDLSAKARTDDKYMLLMMMAIRTMSKAEYSTDNIGHYGLHFDYYTHFTSPIRRYSDVLVHRVLEKNLEKDHYADKEKLQLQCIHISKQERRAMEAERDSIKYKKAEYMADHIGEEYDGIVSGMIERGVFIEISETKAEGMIPFDRFKENYTVQSGRYKAVGSNPKDTLKMGDKLRVKVMSVDLESKQIELEVVE
jgi:ribonuclease R